MAKRLRLFVWEDVLCDYTCGIAFALAYDVDEARRLVVASDRYATASDIEAEPKVYDAPVGYAIHGGG